MSLWAYLQNSRDLDGGLGCEKTPQQTSQATGISFCFLLTLLESRLESDMTTRRLEPTTLESLSKEEGVWWWWNKSWLSGGFSLIWFDFYGNKLSRRDILLPSPVPGVCLGPQIRAHCPCYALNVWLISSKLPGWPMQSRCGLCAVIAWGQLREDWPVSRSCALISSGN